MKRHCFPKVIFTVAVAIVFSLPLNAQETIHLFDSGLSTPLKGKYGREAVFQDPVLLSIANDEWKKPVAELEVEDGSSGDITWEKVEAGDNNVFRHRNLRGGYFYCEYRSNRKQVVILEASGYNEVFVNGEPRGGDVYNFGWVQHPVQMQRGTNTFLFRGSRGQLSARLTKPEARIFLSDRDVLLPDWPEGSKEPVLGAIRLINASTIELKGYKITSIVNGQKNMVRDIPVVGSLTSRKIPFVLQASGAVSGEEIELSFVIIGPDGKENQIKDPPVFKIQTKSSLDKRKETFISGIDGSIQYYSIVPSSNIDQKEQALFFSLHGASVEAVNQAGAYSPKDWGILIAPTNRRPYGFDWEDWGRLDAKEVLGIVNKKYSLSPKHQYLTGHSMGGHGTWQFGVTYPGNWAAIAPSAGWYSFWSYGGKKEVDSPSALEQEFARASNPSHTLALSRNYLHYGVYILHGDKDDNVPVSQARFMREYLSTYHPDFCYYERPGAGHWWGNECVDWPPLFDFFKNHERPEARGIKNLDFSTSSPGVSSESRFLTIWQQEKCLEISNVKLAQDTISKEIKIKSENVAVMKLDLGHLQGGQPYEISFDRDTFKVDPGKNTELFFEKGSEGWNIVVQPVLDEKGPHRYGMFKEAFQNNMVFVYGTNGRKEENDWAYQKARFDAETFWYRGNGAIDVISDKEFLKGNMRKRNVILYGHSDMNQAWESLIPNSPIKVKRGEVLIGSESIPGDDLAACFVFPNLNEDLTSVGVVAGTGKAGMISAIPNRYFVSGSGFPDFMIYNSEMLQKGIEGVVAAGYFDQNWELSDSEYHLNLK